MNRQLMTALSAWLLASVALGAADVGKSKPFNAWTDAELMKVLMHPPWSGRATASPKEYPRILRDSTLVLGRVTWLSAQVMREVRARQRMGATSGAVPIHLQNPIDTAPDWYVLTYEISGPSWEYGTYACLAKTMIKDTFLKRAGKPPIAAEWADGTSLDANRAMSGCPNPPPPSPYGCLDCAHPDFGRERSSVIVFYFPRTAPITAADGEVEFVTRLASPDYGPSYVKRTFKLKDMIVNGELQL